MNSDYIKEIISVFNERKLTVQSALSPRLIWLLFILYLAFVFLDLRKANNKIGEEEFENFQQKKKKKKKTKKKKMNSRNDSRYGRKR